MRFMSLIALALALAGCNPFAADRQVSTFKGKTMGTTYQVKAINLPDTVTQAELHTAIEASLKQVNNNLSNWHKTSEVSSFNASPSTSWTPVSDDFKIVMKEAFRIHNESNGRFDVTLAPLINLWGFGPKKQTDLPDDGRVRQALLKVGMTRLLEFEANPPRLRKRASDVSVNLSAIAKGFGVDRIARTLRDHGIDEYLVEIGGDMVARGRNGKDELWQVGIETPDAISRSIQLIVPVSDFGLATSGDYRNFVMKDGKRYSHILDPVTGKPVTHELASVTVLAENAMRADGLATAILVLGTQNGMELANRLMLPVFFIIRGENGFIEKRSVAFQTLMLQHANGQ